MDLGGLLDERESLLKVKIELVMPGELPIRVRGSAVALSKPAILSCANEETSGWIKTRVRIWQSSGAWPAILGQAFIMTTRMTTTVCQ